MKSESKNKKYTSPAAFRMALEERLKNISKKENVDIQRLRRELSFDRFLTRIFESSHSPWVLKGGYAMELRFKEARATRDIDLGMKIKTAPNKAEVLETLQNEASKDMNDHFEFIVGKAMMDLEGSPYGGARYPVDARMDGRTFAKFHVDIAIGDILIEPLKKIKSRDWLSFSQIPAGKYTAISEEQQFAEKIHAYTLPRQRPNSRVRDIVDMVILIHSKRMNRKKTKEMIQETFKRRKSHPVPPTLPIPTPSWKEPFRALAKECGINEEIEKSFSTITSFYQKLL